MKIMEMIMATTDVDKHKERFAREALETMIEQSKENYIPTYFEHDYRNPPIGRIADTYLRENLNGQTLIGVIELFDIEDIGKIEKSKKELKIHEYKKNTIQIGYDRSYKSDTYLKLIRELQNSVDKLIEPQEEIKKALDPISFLLMGMSFILGSIATGFLGKIGSDGYDKFKKALNNIIQKKKKENQEFVFTIDITVITNDGNKICTQIHYSNPETNDIVDYLGDILQKIDDYLLELYKENSDLRKVVFTIQNMEPKLSYIVRKSGIPDRIEDIEKYGTFIKAARKK